MKLYQPIHALLAQAETIGHASARKALRLFQKAHQSAKKIQYQQGLAESLFGIAQMELGLSNFGEALENATKALAAFEKLRDHIGCLKACNSLGASHYHLGNYETALEFYLRALKRAEQIENLEWQAGALGNIGSVYVQLGDFKNSLVYRTKALAIFREMKQYDGEAVCLNNIGNIYFRLENYTSALKYYRESLSVREQHGAPTEMRIALSNIGETLGKLRRPTEATLYLNRSIELCREFGDRRLEAENLIKLAELTIDGERKQETLHRALALADALHISELSYRANELLAEHYSRHGDFKNAFEHYKAFHRVKEAMFNDESERKLRAMRVAFEVREKEQENERLREQLTAKEKELLIHSQCLIERNETQTQMRARLLDIRARAGADAQKIIDKYLAKIETKLSPKDTWATFERQFSHTYPEFFSRLSQRYPALSPTELKVCALLKVGHSTKDMAQLLFISRHTVSEHRGNIRKKMKLGATDNLSSAVAKF